MSPEWEPPSDSDENEQPAQPHDPWADFVEHLPLEEDSLDQPQLAEWLSEIDDEQDQKLVHEFFDIVPLLAKLELTDEERQFNQERLLDIVEHFRTINPAVADRMAEHLTNRQQALREEHDRLQREAGKGVAAEFRLQIILAQGVEWVLNGLEIELESVTLPPPVMSELLRRLQPIFVESEAFQRPPDPDNPLAFSEVFWADEARQQEATEVILDVLKEFGIV